MSKKHKNRYNSEEGPLEMQPDLTELDDFDSDQDDESTEETAQEPQEQIPEQVMTTPIINQPEEAPMPTELEPKKIETTAPQTDAVAPKKTITTKFDSLATKYIALAKQGLRTNEQKKEAVKIFSEIAHVVTTSHDRAVFDACFSFMLKNRAILMGEPTVIGNVTAYADATKVNRIMQFYVVFTSLIEAKMLHRRYSINIGHIRDIFNNKQLADWISDHR